MKSNTSLFQSKPFYLNGIDYFFKRQVDITYFDIQAMVA